MSLIIDRIKIKGLFGQFDVNLPLNQNVNIFLGENGMGKTTILNCLYYILSGNIEKLNTIVFEEISLYFNDDNKKEFKITHKDLVAYEYEKNRGFRYQETINRMLYIFSEEEQNLIKELYKNNPNDEELVKFYYKFSEELNIPLEVAKQRLIHDLIDKERGDFKNIINFKNEVAKKVNNKILYFPTYRRIEEDISNLGLNIREEGSFRFKIDEVKKSRIIQFGMEDVENNIKKLLVKIKSLAITGFTKMTAILLKQYLSGELLSLEDYKIDKEKLEIALARIGDEIDNGDKQKIIELVNNCNIYNEQNRYLLNLIKNLIDSYEKQNLYDERIKKFISVCNGYLNAKKYVYDESNVEIGIFKENTQKPIAIKNLSSGEKQIISVFSKLYIEDTSDCIILFDEPELSLSILWQTKFLPDIMNSGKCSSLIVVTHSPFIFDNEYDELAKSMGDFLKNYN